MLGGAGRDRGRRGDGASPGGGGDACRRAACRGAERSGPAPTGSPSESAVPFDGAERATLWATPLIFRLHFAGLSIPPCPDPNGNRAWTGRRGPPAARERALLRLRDHLGEAGDHRRTLGMLLSGERLLHREPGNPGEFALGAIMKTLSVQ